MIINGLKIEANKMYFQITLGWRGELVVPFTQGTTQAIAALFEGGVMMSERYRKMNDESGISYLTGLDDEGAPIEPPRVQTVMGSKLIDQLSKDPRLTAANENSFLITEAEFIAAE